MEHSFLRGLNEAQLQVAIHRGSPLLVFAAAGTGKTQALASRIAHIVSNDGVPPHKILALTFTRKAAAEMRERTALMCGIDEAHLRNVGTFHSLCVSLLRKYGFYKQAFNRLNTEFTILDPEDMDAIIDEQMWDGDCFDTALRRHSGSGSSGKRQKELEDAVKIPVIRNRIEVWRNRGLDPDDAQVILESSESLVSRVAQEVYVAYRSVCARRNVVDFGDLILHACTTLERVPGALEDCRRNAYSHLLIDEFQDTNEAQMRLVRILCSASEPTIQGLSIDQLMVVGDDYQAIHEWRGSNVRNILEFTKEFPTTRTICLYLNYRSLPSILEAARNVIAKNTNQKHKELQATRVDESSKAVSVIEYKSVEDEADNIAEQIYQACFNERMNLSQYAILYRSNAHSQPLEAALRARGIPYKLRGGTRSFFERAEIKDVMAYARLLLNPRSDQDFERAIHVPHRGIGERTIENLRKRVDDGSCTCLLEAAIAEAESQDCSKNKKDALEAFVALFSSTSNASLREILQASGYLQTIKEGPKENVIALLDLVERDPNRSLREIIDACSLHDSPEEENCSDGFVSLMTMHASKGLEFEIVYVAGFAEGSLPHSLSVLEGNIEEERRLCYVAITRARDRLVLCVPKTRMRFGESKATTASRFLAEAFPD